MAEQHDNLVRALSFVVEKADRFEDLKDALEALGRRHVGYGVRDRHYESVGAAPIWTLEQGLGDRFSPEARAAWTIAYALISGTMREAANQASSEAA
jgi:hemoglobin-like flavoprotein